MIQGEGDSGLKLGFPSGNHRDSLNMIIWVQYPVLVNSLLEVFLCPVFFTVAICLDHVLLKRPDMMQLQLHMFRVEIEIIVWLL